ncbi:MAG: hypothetical protein ACUVQR_10715 [Thermogutta sp.]
MSQIPLYNLILIGPLPRGPSGRDKSKNPVNGYLPNKLGTMENIKMKLSNRGPWSALLVLWIFVSYPLPVVSYEVWIGTLGWQQDMVTRPDEWARTAELVEGLNVNWARGQKDDNRLDSSRRGEVIARLTKARNHAYQVLPHGAGPITAEKDWQGIFDRASQYGYTLEYLLTYSSGPGKIWKPAEHELLRKWLDQHGHSNTKIAFIARSGHGTLERSVVQGNAIECDLTSWKENKGGRHELLRWMADPSNPATKGEKIFIHCHLNYGQANNEADLVDVWAGARLMVRDIGRDVLNTEELRKVFQSDRLVFCFFGGNWTTRHIALLPELVDERTYAQSYTGLLLSLIEQRDLFEGRFGSFPSDAQCRSTDRVIPQVTFQPFGAR